MSIARTAAATGGFRDWFMAKASDFPAPFTLGPWRVQAELNRITGPGGAHQIEPRIMRVLLVLVEHAGGVVTRQDLLDEVWADAIVGEEILTRAVSELRRVFGDDPRQPAYIETIRQHGYRLIMPVGQDPVPAADPAPAGPPVVNMPAAEPPLVQAPAADPPAVDPPAAPAPAVEPAAPAALFAAAEPAAPAVRRLARALAGRALPLLAVAAAGLALVTAPAWWPGLDRSAPASTVPVPLTSYPGRELHPALSPDGARVAFAWSGPDDRSPGIYIKQRNSETALRLTAEPGWPAWPVWLPDGQSVAFVQTADTASAICLVSSLGGPVRRLREVPSLVDGLTVSADGLRLAWAARATGRGPYRLEGLAVNDPTTMWRPAPPTGAAADVQPRLSPDGRWLAWVAVGPGGDGTIYRTPVAGGEVAAVAHAHGPIAGLAWTPDSRQLVYAAAPAGAYGLWRVDLDGSRPEAVALAAEFVWNPTIAARSGDLAFEQVRLDQDIWRLRVLEREPWRFETAPFLVSTRWEADADLDPATGRVVFVSLRSGRPQVWTTGTEGTDPAPLTDLEAAALSAPRWSPDGTRVAFRVVTDEGAAVMVVPAVGGRPRAVPLAADDLLPAGWSRDGRTILVAADLGDGWQLHRVDPVDGSRQALTRAGGLTGAETADGRDLYHTRPGLAGLWRLSLAGGEPELVIPALLAGDRAAWRLTGDAITWVLRVRGRAVLMRHDLVSGVSQPLAELPGFAAGALGVSGTGEVVLYSHAGEAAGDLMLLSAFAAPEK